MDADTQSQAQNMLALASAYEKQGPLSQAPMVKALRDKAALLLGVGPTGPAISPAKDQHSLVQNPVSVAGPTANPDSSVVNYSNKYKDISTLPQSSGQNAYHP